MNIKDILKIKDEDGKYIRKAMDVAKHHGVHVNSVNKSRKKTGKLDKLMAYDEACKVKTVDADIKFIGQREIILDALGKFLQNDKSYFITCAER